MGWPKKGGGVSNRAWNGILSPVTVYFRVGLILMKQQHYSTAILYLDECRRQLLGRVAAADFIAQFLQRESFFPKDFRR